MIDTQYQAHLEAALEQQDAEKALILRKFDEISTPLQELSDLRVELIHRTTELHEAQHKTSDLQIMVQEEREKVARLLAENASHMCQAEDDRTRIQSLLRLLRSEFDGSADTPLAAFPINVHHGKRPVLSATMSLRSLIASPGTEGTKSTSSVGLRSQRDSKLLAVIDSALQTPPESGLVFALREELNALKTQQDHLRSTYERDRTERLTEERQRHKQQEDCLLKFNKTIDHLQAVMNETTRELCTYRQAAQITERQLRGEVEALRANCTEFEAALAKERSRRTADMKETLHAAATRSNDVVDRLRGLVKEKETVHHRREQELEERCKRLETEAEKATATAATMKKRCADAERRHRLEQEGLHSELNLCKQELRALQKRVYFAYQRGETQFLTGEHPPTADETTSVETGERAFVPPAR